MMYAVGLTYGQKHEEMLEMDKMAFPYTCYYREMNRKFNAVVPWHWHKSIEMDYLLEGKMELVMPEQTLLLKAGDICFINSELLHSFHITQTAECCRFYAHLFDASLLYGMPNSQIQQKYILPVLGNPSVTTVHFPDGSRKHREIEKVFLDIVKKDQEHPWGYEFSVREGLSKLWCLMFEDFCSGRETVLYKEEAGSKRVKEMLRYVHEHFREPLSLKNIAGASGVSPQECMRCFRKNIHLSPIAYLTEYRVRMAAEELLHTDQSILTISENCGFSSNSYFTKVFQKIMGTTPSAYRKNCLKDGRIPSSKRYGIS